MGNAQVAVAPPPDPAIAQRVAEQQRLAVEKAAAAVRAQQAAAAAAVAEQQRQAAAAAARAAEQQRQAAAAAAAEQQRQAAARAAEQQRQAAAASAAAAAEQQRQAAAKASALKAQQDAAEAEQKRLQQQAAAQAAAAQAAAAQAAEAQKRAAADAAARAAEQQRLAQLEIERARVADELAKARAQIQAVSAQLASSQAHAQEQAAAATTARAEATDSGQTVTTHIFTDMGCWKDTGDRAISGGYVGTPGTDAYNTSRCYALAKSRGHNIFAIQAGFACFTGIEMRDNYKKYGAAPKPCSLGGGSWINRVYKINSPDVIIPHDVGSYSDWSAVPSLLSDFQTQAANLFKSLSSIDTSNPAPYMTAMDTNVNAIRDAATVQQLKVLNSNNIKEATQIFKTATDMSGPIQDSKNEAENLRRKVSLSNGQNAGFQGNLLPLQILVWTLVGVLVIHFIAGVLLPRTIATALVLAGLASGFGAAVYFAINKQS